MNLFIFVTIVYLSTSVNAFCGPGILDPENSEYISNPDIENFINDKVKVRFVNLKQGLLVETQNSRNYFFPETDADKKNIFSQEIMALIRSFPKEVFKKFNEDICFVIVKPMKEEHAVTIRNIIFISQEAPQDTIAHELMHVFDNLFYNGDLSFTGWDKINQTHNCLYGRPFNFSLNSETLEPFEDGCFSSSYGKFGIFEDRAEIFSALSRNANLLNQNALAENNQALTKKILNLKKFMKILSPGMNEEFWNSRSPDFVHESWK